MSAPLEPTRLPRRTVLGAAWAAPVVALAITAPAAAARQTSAYALAVSPNPLVIAAPGTVSFTNLRVQNTGAETLTGTVTSSSRAWPPTPCRWAPSAAPAGLRLRREHRHPSPSPTPARSQSARPAPTSDSW